MWHIEVYSEVRNAWYHSVFCVGKCLEEDTCQGFDSLDAIMKRWAQYAPNSKADHFQLTEIGKARESISLVRYSMTPTHRSIHDPNAPGEGIVVSRIRTPNYAEKWLFALEDGRLVLLRYWHMRRRFSTHSWRVHFEYDRQSPINQGTWRNLIPLQRVPMPPDVMNEARRKA